MLIDFSNKKSILNTFVAELRCKETQKDRMRFRKNLERVGEILSYEISQKLEFRDANINTPLGIAPMQTMEQPPVLATILRAGIPLHQGCLNYFDGADSCFISAYRKHSSELEFDIEIEYLSSPSLDNRTVILTDPMLASGASMVLAYQALLKRGTPKQLHVVSAIASKTGVEYAMHNLPEKTYFWIAAIDEQLSDTSYIIPGLGDAGDLAFGKKIDS